MQRKGGSQCTSIGAPNRQIIAVFPILADVIEVKTGSRSTAHWSNDFRRLNGWLRNCFAQLITPLDIDGIGQNWEDSNTVLDTGTSSQQVRLVCEVQSVYI